MGSGPSNPLIRLGSTLVATKCVRRIMRRFVLPSRHPRQEGLSTPGGGIRLPNSGASPQPGEADWSGEPAAEIVAGKPEFV